MGDINREVVILGDLNCSDHHGILDVLQAAYGAFKKTVVITEQGFRNEIKFTEKWFDLLI